MLLITDKKAYILKSNFPRLEESELLSVIHISSALKSYNLQRVSRSFQNWIFMVVYNPRLLKLCSIKILLLRDLQISVALPDN